MPPLKSITSLFLTPLLYLNMAGLGAGAIWLGAQAQWQVIWIGFLMIVFSSHIIPILVIPAGIFSHFMTLYRTAQRPDRERTMLFLSLAYIVLFLTAWCTCIFDYVMHNIASKALGAGLLWACTAALAPLLWWSSRDRNNVFIITMVEVAQVAIIVLAMIRLLSGGISFWPAFAIFGGIQAAVTAAQIVYEEKFMNKTKETPR